MSFDYGEHEDGENHKKIKKNKKKKDTIDFGFSRDKKWRCFSGKGWEQLRWEKGWGQDTINGR